MHETIHAFGLTLASQQVVFCTAVVAAVVLGPIWIAHREGLSLGRLRASQLMLGVFALGGARLHFIFNNPHFYGEHPLNAFLPWGGIHMGGALIGLLVGLPLTARWYRLSVPKLCDGTIVVTAVCLAATRVGCLLGGCCFGTRCERVWAITYPPGSFPYRIHQQAGLIAADAAASLPVHPSQVYFLLAALGTAALCIAVGDRKRYDGQVFWIGIIALSATTALLEPFRALENHRVFWASVPQLVWTELALTAIGLIGLVVSERRHRRAAATRTDPAPLPLLRATDG